MTVIATCLLVTSGQVVALWASFGMTIQPQVAVSDPDVQTWLLVDCVGHLPFAIDLISQRFISICVRSIKLLKMGPNVLTT